MKIYISLVLTLGVAHCRAMEVDPLAQANHLLEVETTSVEDINACIRSLAKSMPLKELNDFEIELLKHQSGEYAKRRERLKAHLQSSSEVSEKMGDMRDFCIAQLDSCKALLGKMSKPTTPLVEGSADKTQSESLEKKVLKEMIGILAFQIYASKDMTEEVEKRKKADYQRLRNLVSDLVHTLDIDFSKITSSDSIIINERPVDYSSDEEMIGPKKKTPQKGNESLSAIDPKLLDEFEEMGNLLASTATNSQQSYDEIPVDETHTNILESIEQVEELSSEQRAMQDYILTIKKITYLTDLVDQSAKFLTAENQDKARNRNELKKLKDLFSLVKKSHDEALKKVQAYRKASAALKERSKNSAGSGFTLINK